MAVSRLVNQEEDAQMTLGQRVADRVAQFGGSWSFLLIFAGVLVAWVGVNTWVLSQHPSTHIPTSS